MEFKANIERLTGCSNWTKWRRQIELVLRHNDVLEYALGKANPPAEIDVGASAVERSKYEEELKDFTKKDSLAQLILISNMDDNNVELTATSKSAKTLWEKLLSVYEQSSGQRLDRLMEDFFRREDHWDGSIVAHVAKLQKNFAELNDELNRVAGTTLPDLLLMSRIMSTLPAAYFEFKSVWESISIKDRSTNLLTERLRLIEMRLPSKPESEAFVAKKKEENENKQSVKNPVGKKPVLKCGVIKRHPEFG